jgi:hypothetical protein
MDDAVQAADIPTAAETAPHQRRISAIELETAAWDRGYAYGNQHAADDRVICIIIGAASGAFVVGTIWFLHSFLIAR